MVGAEELRMSSFGWPVNLGCAGWLGNEPRVLAGGVAKTAATAEEQGGAWPVLGPRRRCQRALRNYCEAILTATRAGEAAGARRPRDARAGYTGALATP